MRDNDPTKAPLAHQVTTGPNGFVMVTAGASRDGVQAVTSTLNTGTTALDSS